VTDDEIILAVLERDERNEAEGGPTLSDLEREAFPGMRGRRCLTDKQKAWFRDAAARLGVELPAENLFSSLSEKEKKEHARRAKSVELPWEKPGYVKVLKPPKRK
jgi:hypothetical protein